MSNRAQYQNPLNERYSSKEMSYIFSDENKFKTWRSLWIALAIAQKELGLDITDEQITQMKEFESDINYDEAKKIVGAVTPNYSTCIKILDDNDLEINSIAYENYNSKRIN